MPNAFHRLAGQVSPKPPAPTGNAFHRLAEADAVTPENHIQKAAEYLDALRGAGRKVPALAKQAIVDNFRTQAGMDPLLGIDHYARGRAAVNKKSALANYAAGVGGGLVGLGADILGSRDPAAGNRLAAAGRAYYGDVQEGRAGKVGSFLGTGAPLAPALVFGGAPGMATMFGIAGTGGVRRNVEARRAAGQEISTSTEWTAALTTGAVEAASGFVGAKLLGMTGQAMTALAPGAAAIMKTGGSAAVKEFLVKGLAKLLGVAGAEYTEEALTTVATNAILKVSDIDPDIALTEGAHEAGKMGAMLTPFLGPLANVRSRSGLTTPPGLMVMGRPLPPIPTVKGESRDLMLRTEREFRAKVGKAGATAKKWQDKHSDSDLRDVGAYVERIGRTDRSNETPQSVQSRMTPEKIEMAKEYAKVQEETRQEVNKFLDPTTDEEYIAYLEDYLPHFYVSKNLSVKSAARWLAKNSPNAQKRTLPTLADAQKAGLTPITQNVAELHKMWAAVNWRVATTRRFLGELNSMTDSNGDPVVMRASKAPADWVKVEHSALQKIVFGGKTKGKVILKPEAVAVHPDAAPFVKALVDKPIDNWFLNKIEGLNAWAKKLSLSISLFHHIALTESAQAVLAKMTNPVRGIMLIGEVDPTTGKRKAFQRPHKVGMRLMQDPEFLQDSLRAGHTLDATSDVHVGRIARDLLKIEAKVQNVPVLKQAVKLARTFNTWWDKKLWQHYHSGLKAFAYYDIVSQELKRSPTADATEVKETAANFLNDAFGGQEWMNTVLRHPRVRQVLQMSFLAPDWTFSNLKIAGRTLIEDPNSFRGRLQIKYWRNMAPSLYVSAVALQYAIFLAFGDEEKGDKPWIWQNEKDKKWDIDVTPIMRIMADAGLRSEQRGREDQRYYTHFGKQAREPISWMEDPISTARRKTSPAVQIVMEQVTGSQGGGFNLDFAEKPFWEGLGGRGIAIAGKFVPFSFRGSNFAFTSPLSKGMTPWKARNTMMQELRAYADPTILDKVVRDHPNFEPSLRSLFVDTLEAAERNGHDSEKLFRQSLGALRGEMYRAYFQALSDQDHDGMDDAAESIIRLHAWLPNLINSARERDIDLTSVEVGNMVRSFVEAEARVKEKAEE